MKRWMWAVVLLAVVSLSGCGAMRDQAASEQVLYGWDLQEPGYGYTDYAYRCDLSEAVVVEPRPLEVVELMPQYGQWAYGEYAAGDLRGAYSRIDYRVQDAHGTLLVPLMYLQHVDKSQWHHKPEAGLWIKERVYSKEELAPQLVYENERACVYDLTAYFIEEWPAYLEQFIKENDLQVSEELALRMGEAYTALQAHRQDLLQPAEPKALGHYDPAIFQQVSEHNQAVSAAEPFLWGYEEGPGMVPVLPVELDEVNMPGKKAFEMVAGDLDWVGYESEDCPLPGWQDDDLYGAVCVLTAGGVPIGCWQCFYKADLNLPEARIQLKGRAQRPEALAHDQVGENEVLVVYDFTESVLGPDFAAYWQQCVQAGWAEEEEAQWIKQCYELIRVHRHDLWLAAIGDGSPEEAEIIAAFLEPYRAQLVTLNAEIGSHWVIEERDQKQVYTHIQTHQLSPEAYGEELREIYLTQIKELPLEVTVEGK